eukprot:CAMPEP_0113620764 /NCGR_PEP_ID=MMETSP0017_2-20120614/10589_1 /TAXON_ID=2856 /ORGANISM="Cylindrotheca closterium" /LENGTH=182 /DNA_ID=CAMNT_0000530451 /DNA_START=39 /DNA_END=587 /DNA_ORIENTATION=+ /assembly_acc=CAM_ASM_000147
MKFLATLSFLAAAVTPVASQSIIDLAAADGKYGTLLGAVTNTAGVLDAVTSNFPVTIFGPTDAAFADIASVVAGLDEAALATVLASHVVPGVFTAQNVIDAGCVELVTLSGANVRVMYKDGKVMVNESTVIQADIIGDGGIIHGIDKVILPGSYHACPAKSSKKMSSSSGKGSGKGSKRRMV